jgi:hypothetical protein
LQFKTTELKRLFSSENLAINRKIKRQFFPKLESANVHAGEIEEDGRDGEVGNSRRQMEEVEANALMC